MKSFLEFFEERNGVILEYRHKDGFGDIKQSLHANNKKGGNITRDPLTRKIPWNKGPYKKIRTAGEILIGDDLLKELGDLNGVEFQDGKEIKRKNSNQILKLFTNLHGQQCGKIVEINVNFHVEINEDVDYRGQHTAPDKEGSSPAYDLSDTYPDDIYSQNAVRYYGHWGDSRDNAAISIIQSLRGNPNKAVKIYRAIPKDKDSENVKKAKMKIQSLERMATSSPHLHNDPYFKKQIEEYSSVIPNNKKIQINTGDWVTTVKSYAKDHGESALRGEYQIISKIVKSKDIYTNGDSIFEWGYHPS
jgi:hypothetical protein